LNSDRSLVAAPATSLWQFLPGETRELGKL
jgi:hypothetical protein